LSSCIDEFGLMGGLVFDLPGCADPALEAEMAYDSMVQDAFSHTYASTSSDTPCEQGVVQSVITAQAGNLGLNLSGYNMAGATASIGGQTSGMLGNGTDGMTELVVHVDPTATNAWGDLQASLVAAGFNLYTGDSMHPGAESSYRQNVGSWSMQVSFSADHSTLNIDIDPHNPMYGDLVSAIGHGIDVLAHAVTGNDTNYHSVASALGMNVQPCGGH
jgi:hypothetical protein